MTFSACIVALCDAGLAESDRWREGPLPLPYGPDRITDADLRATYFTPRVAGILYGSEKGPGRRAHISLDEPESIDASLGVSALEFLVVQGAPDPIAIVHVTSGTSVRDEDLLASWMNLLRWKRNPKQATRLTEIVDGIAGCSSGLRGKRGEPLHLAFISDGSRQIDDVHARAGLVPRDQWLAVLATATSGADVPIPASGLASLADPIELSADWSALVLRDGVSFVGHPLENSRFLEEFAPTHVHTIYLDVLLLGYAQRIVLADLIECLVAIDDPASEPGQVERLAARFSRFRNAMWWQHVASHGIGTHLLAAYQSQHSIGELVERVRRDLSDYTELAKLRSGRTLNTIATFLASAATIGALVQAYAIYVQGFAPPALAMWGLLVAALGLSLLAMRAGRVKSLVWAARRAVSPR
jgi:hypothetical protein